MGGDVVGWWAEVMLRGGMLGCRTTCPGLYRDVTEQGMLVCVCVRACVCVCVCACVCVCVPHAMVGDVVLGAETCTCPCTCT